MRFRIYRLRESQRENYRWSAHTGGEASLKSRDYGRGETLDAETPYAAWRQLREAGVPLQIGDVLEALAVTESDAELWISKYIGLERAHWHVPAQRPETLPDQMTEGVAQGIGVALAK